MTHSSRWRAGRSIAILTTIIAMAGAFECQAQQNPGDIPPEARRACTADYRKLCPGVRPGEGRVVACFEEHARQLSPGCRQAMRQRMNEQRSH
jgi:hypothetical protein